MLFTVSFHDHTEGTGSGRDFFTLKEAIDYIQYLHDTRTDVSDFAITIEHTESVDITQFGERLKMLRLRPGRLFSHSKI